PASRPRPSNSTLKLEHRWSLVVPPKLRPLDDMTADNEIQLHGEKRPLLPVQDVAEKTYDDSGVQRPRHLGDDEATKSDIWEDVADTLRLAIPIFVSRVSSVGMKTTDTALLGHVSGRALSAAALSDLWTMCTGVFVQGRVLGILVGQSIGANNRRLASVYLRISYLVLGALSVGVMVSWGYTERVWTWLGQSEEVARDAGYYSSVFILSVPAQLWFSQLSQFLSAQRIMKPEVTASLMALLCNLVLGVGLVLGVPFLNFHGFGFKACPLVTVAVMWCQCLILNFYWQNHSANQSPTSSIGNARWMLSWSEGITLDRIRTYSVLYFPAALALSSDFWRMGVIGAIAAAIGEREVGIFNASYRILWITLIFIGALSGATGIKIGLHLGNGSAAAARQVAFVGAGLVLIFLLLLSSAVYFNIRALGMLFTNDESYLKLFEECRLPFTCVLFFMNLSVGIETIPLSMGQMGNVFYAGFVASWLGQVPGVIFLTQYWRNDLYALYTGVAVGKICVIGKHFLSRFMSGLNLTLLPHAFGLWCQAIACWC
ncbi:hypothetical protein ACHAWF_009139, partial [Thalassiosira exigua]